MIRDLLEEINTEFILMDGFDDCIIGICSRYGQEDCVTYDKNKVLKKLTEKGLDEEEAIDFFQFNQIGAYVGPYTPCFVELIQN